MSYCGSMFRDALIFELQCSIPSLGWDLAPSMVHRVWVSGIWPIQVRFLALRSKGLWFYTVDLFALLASVECPASNTCYGFLNFSDFCVCWFHANCYLPSWSEFFYLFFGISMLIWTMHSFTIFFALFLVRLLCSWLQRILGDYVGLKSLVDSCLMCGWNSGSLLFRLCHYCVSLTFTCIYNCILWTHY